jgi:hypothetical protein
MKFNLCKKNDALRWVNALDFVAEIHEPINFSEDGVLIAFLTFNSYQSSLTVLSKMMEDYPQGKFLIVDNNSDLDCYDRLKKGLSVYANVKLIRTILNIGGAGGYALISEIFLRSNFRYLLLTEDDAFPAEMDLISELIVYSDRGDLVGCRYYNNNSNSFSFHFTLYSRRIVECAGVPDPRFFQGGDDAEIKGRHMQALKRFKSTPIFIDRGYYHPTLKGMGTPGKVIRGQRNSLLMELSRGLIINYITRSFILLAYSFFNLFLGRVLVFWCGVSSCFSIAKMNYAGCEILKKKDMQKSLDSSLIFSSTNVKKVSAAAGTSHLSALLGIGRFRFIFQSVFLPSLESPWSLIYMLLARKIFVAKNLSDDRNNVDVAEFSIPVRYRIFVVASLILSVALFPIYGVVLLCNYFMHFKIYSANHVD